MTWLSASRKFKLLFPWELINFIRSGKLVSFDQRHVTRSLPVEFSTECWFYYGLRLAE